MSRYAAESVVRTSANNAARNTRQEDLIQRTHIELRKLPRTALPADIRRLVTTNKLENVKSVAIDYHHFLPSGRGYIKLDSPSALLTALHRLDNATISALPIKAVSSPSPSQPQRFRGRKSKDDALLRAAVTGNGPGGGLPVSQSGMNAVVLGLPGKISSESVKAYFNGFEYIGTEHGTEVVQIHPPDGAFTFVTRFFIRLASVSEAHRLVRHVHMTYYDMETFGPRYLMKAGVIY